MRITSTHIFFWGGFYSNFYETFFTEDGILYSSVEQYFMAKKAQLFGDRERLEMIMSTSDPKLIKKHGRKVKDFDPVIWDSIKKTIMFNGVYKKFDQNDYLKKTILETGDLIFVEASPFDKVWGVGLQEENDEILNEENWKGQNLLGKTLNDVRFYIRKAIEREKAGE